MKELKIAYELLRDDILNITDEKLGKAPQLNFDAREHLRTIENLVHDAIEKKFIRDNKLTEINENE